MDLDKIFIIKEDLNLLINNIDPKTKINISTDTILNNNYNKQLLQDVYELISEYMQLNRFSNNVDKRRKLYFYIREESRKRIPISQEPISISAFTYTLNDFIDNIEMKKIKASEITGWLMSNGYLKEIEHDDGKVFKALTEKASEIGMLRESKTNDYGRTYDVNLYSAQTQQFIVDNLSEISEFIRASNL